MIYDNIAKERYAALGVDTEEILAKLDQIPISIHCWQGDDLRGFEQDDAVLSGGIQSTGNHPGRATTANELRANMIKAISQIPGPAKVNIHAIYGDIKGIERNAIEPKHFQCWVDWAKEQNVGLDFFDGSIDRISAWTVGARNVRKALLIALLEPYKVLQEAEFKFDFTKRLVMMEELKSLPWQAVWEEYCVRKNVPKSLLVQERMSFHRT